MKKLLVSDYDKTLKVNYDFKNDLLMKINVKAIKKFLSEGNVFMLNTGRAFDSIKDEIIKNNIPYSYLACNDGTLLLDNKDRLLKMYDITNPLYNYEYLVTTFNTKKIDYTIDGGYIVLSQDTFANNPNIADKYYLNYNIVDGKVYLTPLTVQEAIQRFISRFDSYKLTEWKHDDYLLEYEIYRKDPKIVFSVYNDKSKIVDELNLFARLFGLQLAVFMERFMFLRHDKITKSTMIEDLRDILDIDKDNVFTIGDNYNDFQMIKDYHGYTMPWGKEALKTVCEGITPSVSRLIKKIKRW